MIAFLSQCNSKSQFLVSTMCKTCLMCVICLFHSQYQWFQTSSTLPFYFPVLSSSPLSKRIQTSSVRLYGLCEQHSHPIRHSIACYKCDLHQIPRSLVHMSSLFLLQHYRWFSSGRFLDNFSKCRRHCLTLNLLQICNVSVRSWGFPQLGPSLQAVLIGHSEIPYSIIILSAEMHQGLF